MANQTGFQFSARLDESQWQGVTFGLLQSLADGDIKTGLLGAYAEVFTGLCLDTYFLLLDTMDEMSRTGQITATTRQFRERVDRSEITGGMTHYTSSAAYPAPPVHDNALVFTGGYKSAIVYDMQVSGPQMIFRMFPDPDATHAYYDKNGTRVRSIPVAQLAQLLEAKIPHWRPAFSAVPQLAAYQKLVRGGPLTQYAQASHSIFPVGRQFQSGTLAYKRARRMQKGLAMSADEYMARLWSK